MLRRQGRFAAFGKVIEGFEEVERLECVPVVQVFPEGVGAVIMQPVEDERMVHVSVETYGVQYEKPRVKRWSTKKI